MKAQTAVSSSDNAQDDAQAAFFDTQNAVKMLAEMLAKLSPDDRQTLIEQAARLADDSPASR